MNNKLYYKTSEATIYKYVFFFLFFILRERSIVWYYYFVHDIYDNNKHVTYQYARKITVIRNYPNRLPFRVNLFIFLTILFCKEENIQIYFWRYFCHRLILLGIYMDSILNVPFISFVKITSGASYLMKVLHWQVLEWVTILVYQIYQWVLFRHGNISVSSSYWSVKTY